MLASAVPAPWPFYGFLLALARVSGLMIFVPLPGIRQGLDLARVVFTASITALLLPQWPRLQAVPSPGQLAGWLIQEAASGMAVGLAVAFFTEALLVAAQVIGLNAGYGYASVIDPQTQADSGVLLVLAQLVAGMLFFTLGFEREVIRIFAGSLATIPPERTLQPARAAELVVRLGAEALSTGFRLAMPVVALLLMVDIVLALLGRLNAQLQLLTLALPVKMLAVLLMLAWMAVLWPKLCGGYGNQALGVARSLLFGGVR